MKIERIRFSSVGETVELTPDQCDGAAIRVFKHIFESCDHTVDSDISFLRLDHGFAAIAKRGQKRVPIGIVGGKRKAEALLQGIAGLRSIPQDAYTVTREDYVKFQQLLLTWSGLSKQLSTAAEGAVHLELFPANKGSRNKPIRLNLRIEVLPSFGFGVDASNLVIRILKQESELGELSSVIRVGYVYDALTERLKDGALGGLLLITGATGEGKTTTCYAMLRYIVKSRDRFPMIVTIEDPVEYLFPLGIQINANRHLDFGYAAALRAALRLNPDVIYIGEVRDSETAHVMVEAALTGHLVIATMHCDSCHRAIDRLIHLGVDPEALSASLLAILNQRLVRGLCDCECIIERDPIFRDATAALDWRMKLDGLSWVLDFNPRRKITGGMEAGRCRQCKRDRRDRQIAVFECLFSSPALVSGIRRWSSGGNRTTRFPFFTSKNRYAFTLFCEGGIESIELYNVVKDAADFESVVKLMLGEDKDSPLCTSNLPGLR